MVVFVVIFILMTLLFLYGSNNSSSEAYIPIHVAVNRFLINTDLKKWAGKEGYMPLHRNKVRTEFTGRREREMLLDLKDFTGYWVESFPFESGPSE